MIAANPRAKRFAYHETSWMNGTTENASSSKWESIYIAAASAAAAAATSSIILKW